MIMSSTAYASTKKNKSITLAGITADSTAAIKLLELNTLCNKALGANWDIN